MMARRWLAVAGACSVLGSSALAGAQGGTAAEALFNRGMERMEAGDFEKACPAIGESYRLDPRAGTLFTLAECEWRRGRLATAHLRYGEYLALFDTLLPDKRAKQQGRDKVARRQRAVLGPQIPELTLTLAPSVPVGTVVKRDEVVLAEAALGLGLRVDPGEHVITLAAPGKPAIERRIKLSPWEKKRIVLDQKEPPKIPGQKSTTPITPPPPIAAAPIAAPPPPRPPPRAPAAGPSGRSIAAYATGAVGLAGLAAGGVLGGLAVAKKGTLASNCGIGGEAMACNDAGLAARDAGRTLGNGSTAALAAGGALLATGAVLLFTEGGKESGRRRAGVRVDVLSLDGRGAVAGVRGSF